MLKCLSASLADKLIPEPVSAEDVFGLPLELAKISGRESAPVSQ